MYNINDRPSAIREVKKYLYAISKLLYQELPRTTVDSYYDFETESAVKEYQRIKGLFPSGEVNLETFTLLFNDFNTAKENDMRIEYVIFEDAFPMSVGTQNENVRILHTVINELTNRFTTLSAVSKGDFYSEKTKDAVRTLEAIFGMPDSGIVSQSFYSRLIDELYAHRRAYQK